jgi:flagellin
MRLMHNIASLNIFDQQNKILKQQAKSVSRISSGEKLSTAADNPNQIANSEKIRMQIRGMQMTQRNDQDGISMLQGADGGLDSATSIIQKIKELTVQAGGVNTPADLAIIQKQIGQLVNGLDDAMNNTEFNGVKLLSDPNTDNSSPDTLSMQVGSNAGETTQIPKYNLTSSRLGDEASGDVLSSIDVTTPEGMTKALGTADKALSMVLNVRSKYGALTNRFESTYNLSTAIQQDFESADSSIRDTDIADEISNYTKNSILIEAGNALMVQSNRMPQDILRILDNVK